MIQQHKLKILIIFTIISFLSGCSKPQQEQKQQSQQVETDHSTLSQQYQTWKAQQDQKLIQEYQQFFAGFLKSPPPMMELMTNRNFMPKNCEYARFSMPPKKYWNNIRSSLILLEKLHENEYFKSYTITASYRSPELNKCVGGAEKSKHMRNFAVDFHVLNPKETNSVESQKLEKKLCEFWLKEGKRYKMGLGVYGNNRFHIDTQAYRTWGKNYSSTSSPCLAK